MRQTHFTRALEKAHANLKEGFRRADEKVGVIPLGQTQLDPRTQKKRILEKDVALGFAHPSVLSPTTTKKKPNPERPSRPLPQTNQQSAKTRSAGKVVNPSGIETALAGEHVVGEMF